VAGCHGKILSRRQDCTYPKRPLRDHDNAVLGPDLPLAPVLVESTTGLGLIGRWPVTKHRPSTKSHSSAWKRSQVSSYVLYFLYLIFLNNQAAVFILLHLLIDSRKSTASWVCVRIAPIFLLGTPIDISIFFIYLVLHIFFMKNPRHRFRHIASDDDLMMSLHDESRAVTFQLKTVEMKVYQYFIMKKIHRVIVESVRFIQIRFNFLPANG
jgi:hypothetical protein